ncbi:MAG: nucleoside hydrolase [Synoicihabitans sp.]
MKAPLILATALVLLTVLHAEPVRLIFDTDMGNDIDDAMALAMIHNLEKRGACELLAVTSTKDHPKSAAFIDALNTFYGRPDIPIGVVRDGVTPALGKYLGLADKTHADGTLVYPHDLRSGEDAPEAVALLRKTLAAQPDRSVTIVQVGFFTNLSRLLKSAPDEYSDLAGPELVERKVKALVIMAGAFQTIRDNTRYLEYNVRLDIPSAQEFTKNWTAPLIWSGFEIGIAAAYPWQSIMEDYEYLENHPIKEGYLDYAPRQPHDRPTWDLTAVLAAVYPDRGYFDLSAPGTVTVEDDGATRFDPDPNGLHHFLKMSAGQTERVREACVMLCVEPPHRNEG